MSDASNEIQFEMTSFRIDNYCHLFATVFLYYDHLLTFDAEIRLLWQRPKTIGTYLFFLNRYFAFFGNIAITFSIFTTTSSPSICNGFGMYRELSLVLTQVIVGILLTLRIYAIYGCSRRVLAFLIVFMVGGAIISVIVMLFVKETHSLAQGCHTGLDFRNAVFVASIWEALFLYDALLFGFILRKAYRARQQIEIGRMGLSLLTIVIRDGTVYFGIMALGNLSNLLTYYFANPWLKGTLSSFASCLSVTLMSRIMLNLYEVHAKGLYATHTDTVARTDMRFTSVMATHMMGVDSVD